MTSKQKKGFRIFIISLHLLIVLLFLLVALTPFLPPHRFWFISLLGLGYPLLLLLVLLCLIISAIKRSKWVILPAVALLLSIQQITAFVAFRTSGEFEVSKNENTLRVLSWNVMRWTENKYSMRGKPENSFRHHMMDVIQMQNADVLCFQEFFQCYAPELFPENIEPIKKMGYPYHYFTPHSITVSGKFQTGLAIFSRYPITDSAFFEMTSAGHSEGFSYADIEFNGKKLRIYNTHLESPGISMEVYSGQEGVSKRSVLGKIKNSYYFRGLQASHIRESMRQSPYPVILCADAGDVPNSMAYFTLREDLQDAFLKKGSGMGRTLRFISPTLRIDYIFADKELEVTQFEKMDLKYSDHLPLIADLEFKN